MSMYELIDRAREQLGRTQIYKIVHYKVTADESERVGMPVGIYCRTNFTPVEIATRPALVEAYKQILADRLTEEGILQPGHVLILDETEYITPEGFGILEIQFVRGKS